MRYRGQPMAFGADVRDVEQRSPRSCRWKPKDQRSVYGLRESFSNVPYCVSNGLGGRAAAVRSWADLRIAVRWRRRLVNGDGVGRSHGEVQGNGLLAVLG
jgi:hypothetical protein